MSNLTKLLACVLLSCFMFSACTMAPDYIRPEAPVAPSYPADPGMGETEHLAWANFFEDEHLRQLIRIALGNNRDLRIALLNIEKLRAQYQIQRADLLPTITADGGFTGQLTPGDLTPSGQATTSHQYSATLGFAAFELDLFGRVRSLTEKSLESFYAVEEDAKTAQITLVAEVAVRYLQLVADREIFDLTKSTRTSRAQQYDLIKSKFDLGIASELEVFQARTSMEEAEVNLAAYATQVGQDMNALVLLLGAQLPKNFPEIRKLSDVAGLRDLPAGMPSELLVRRPDIRSAEHMLLAANADIGAARANFFPRITLTGAFGTMSAEFDDLFTGGSSAWNFMPSISVPLFDTGRNIARLEMSEADRDIRVAGYEKSIQSAFREVADTLVQREYIGTHISAQQSLVASTSSSYRLASDRYNIGISDYLNVLDAERSMYQAEINLVSVLLLREVNALTLYKALGGGWQ